MECVRVLDIDGLAVENRSGLALDLSAHGQQGRTEALERPFLFGIQVFGHNDIGDTSRGVPVRWAGFYSSPTTHGMAEGFGATDKGELLWIDQAIFVYGIAYLRREFKKGKGSVLGSVLLGTTLVVQGGVFVVFPPRFCCFCVGELAFLPMMSIVSPDSINVAAAPLFESNYHLYRPRRPFPLHFPIHPENIPGFHLHDTTLGVACVCCCAESVWLMTCRECCSVLLYPEK